MFRSLCMCKKENDREINEWYNEEKSGRQIGILSYMLTYTCANAIIRKMICITGYT